MKTTSISIGIARNSKNEVLLVEQRASYDSKPNWLLPGGSVDRGENIAGSLKREFKEETGLELISIDGLSYTSQILDPVRSKIFNVNVFEVTLAEGEISPNDPDNDIVSAAFFTPEQAVELLASNKFLYAKEPATDAILHFPENYKYWEYEWEAEDTRFVLKLK